MANNVLKEFLVSLGWKVDEASAAQAEARADETEAKITAATAKAIVARQKAAEKAMAAEIERKVKLGDALTSEEKGLADRLVKLHQVQDAKRQVIENEAMKKARERRATSWKEMQTHATQAVGVAAKVGLAFAGLGIISGGAIGGIAYALNQAAQRFSSLGFATQRTGTTPRGVQAFGFAAGQLGGDAETAQNEVMELGRKLRMPGWRRTIERQYGVSTTDANGNPRPAEAVAAELGPVFARIRDRDKKMGLPNALWRAEQLGFGEETTFAMMDPKFRGVLSKQQAEQAKIGGDPNKAAEAATPFAQAWNRIENNFSTLATKIQTDLFATLTPVLDKFGTWLAEHGKQITDAINSLIDAAAKLATALANSSIIQAAMKSLGDGLASISGGTIDTIRKGMESFAEYVGSQEFKDDVRDFAKMIGQLAKSIKTALQWLGFIDDPEAQKRQAAREAAIAAQQRQDEVVGANEQTFGSASRRFRAGPFGTKLRQHYPAEKDPLVKEKLDAIRRSGQGGTYRTARSDAANPNFNADNSKALIAKAAELGTTPEDLATVIAYETGGSFSPSKWGGTGGNYLGLIQMGGSERAQFGANENQTFTEQLDAAGRFLKARGFKPGMGIEDLYSTINAGRPGLYSASDGRGTVLDHVARMQQERAAQARAFVALGKPTAANAKAAFGTLKRTSFGAPLLSDYQGKDGILTDESLARYEAARNAYSRANEDRTGRARTSSLIRPLGEPPGLASVDNSSSRNVKVDHSQTFNITGGDINANLGAARLSASRGQQDTLRNVQSALG